MELTFSITSKGDTITGSTKIEITASTFSSVEIISITFLKFSAVPPGKRSTGLSILPSGFTISRNVLFVESLNLARIKFLFSSASTHNIAGPPAFVTTATRLPSGILKFSNHFAVLKSPLRLSARIIPNWLRRESTTLSLLLKAPVCDAAALIPL